MSLPTIDDGTKAEGRVRCGGLSNGGPPFDIFSVYISPTPLKMQLGEDPPPLPRMVGGMFTLNMKTTRTSTMPILRNTRDEYQIDIQLSHSMSHVISGNKRLCAGVPSLPLTWHLTGGPLKRKMIFQVPTIVVAMVVGGRLFSKGTVQAPLYASTRRSSYRDTGE